ncbi:MAG: glutathione S-transferase N-terminal domain-containing protein [Actinomycetota bacterium]|nr:glutathione S-transferase N-terminal domain-containing protein [Actinomycetota bacterium]
MPARLVTIPISHFCEKARWALDRAGVDYVEQPHLQLIHIAAAKFAGGGRTAPVFVTSEGQVLPESAAILHWADTQVEPEQRLYPEGELGTEAAALEAWLDQGFGPDGRVWMYHQTLPVVHELDHWATVGIPRWERRCFRMGGPMIEIAMRRYLKVDAATSATALERVDGVFDDIAARLSDGRRFILGDRFTAADLTFAALAAPMLLPARYGSPLPPPEAMPEAAAREVRRLRVHPAGEFADRLYAQERVRLAAVAA